MLYVTGHATSLQPHSALSQINVKVPAPAPLMGLFILAVCILAAAVTHKPNAILVIFHTFEWLQALFF